jgi:deoxyribodipyrimidine photolyase-like uncharacterized protein
MVLDRENQNALFKGYYKSVPKLWICTSYSAINDNRELCAFAGINPDELDAWYLGIYIDAIEWVEITNTRGMSQFADGGIVGTKPYVSSASYINKMSHYWRLFYDKEVKTGEKACPFNSLYWNFYNKNEDKLENPRIGMMYNVWNKMKPIKSGFIRTSGLLSKKN